MNKAEDFILNFEGHQKEIMLFFHSLLTEEYNLTPKFQYNLPFYYRKSWICYLFPTKKGLVELAFTRGKELSNAQGLLKSRGRKMVSSIEFEQMKNIPVAEIREVIHEAIILDETIPYTFRIK
jgi:hypothetical protein